jgi:hypothetical protein
MNTALVEKAAAQFGQGIPAVQDLGTGLIHRTYKVDYSEGTTAVLQCINQRTFPQPEHIIQNYLQIEQQLGAARQQPVPPLLRTIHSGKYYWIDDSGNFWRATQYIGNTYAPALPSDAREVFTAAKTFASFTHSLHGLPANKLSTIIPRFHDLAFRYQQFEEAVAKAPLALLMKATHVISEIRNRLYLVAFYRTVENDNENFPLRIMHHDCKISNILFDNNSRKAICPVDLDTVMPGKFFSDLGDMIRTMACTKEENSRDWELIDVIPDYYNAIVSGYLEGLDGELTIAEQASLHKAGPLLTCMQCIRFVTDFLNGDIYYQTSYAGQNLNRALNQLIYLEKLEQFISNHYPAAAIAK